MSKLTSMIFLVLFLALLNIATSTRLRATRDVQAGNTSIRSQEGASRRCPKACEGQKLNWNKSWTNKEINKEMFGFCGCH